MRAASSLALGVQVGSVGVDLVEASCIRILRSIGCGPRSDLERRPQLSEGDVSVRGGLVDVLSHALTLPHLIVATLCCDRGRGLGRGDEVVDHR